MRNLLLVAQAEYNRLVRRRSFLIATLAVPLLIAIVAAVAILIATQQDRQRDLRPLGYVDQAGVLRSELAAEQNDGDLTLLSFADAAAATAALEAGEIQAFWLVPSDYRATARVDLRYWQKAPPDEVNGQFQRFLRASLLADLPADAQAEAGAYINITMRTLGETGEKADLDVFGIIMPLLLGMAFVFVVMGSAGYLLQAVTTEKENRMVEVMLTTLSPFQLISGKALGLMGVALTQMGIWLIAILIGLFVLSRSVEMPAGLGISPQFALVAALYFLPTFALVTGMMILIGSMVTDLQHGQQISGVVNLLFMVPFFFFMFVFTNPDSPLMVALTLFPTTAFMAVAMRWGATTIPLWQLITSWVLLVAAAAGLLWVAAKVFHVGMLRYGQPLSLAALGGILRPGRRPAGVR